MAAKIFMVSPVTARKWPTRFARGAAALVVSWRQTCPHPVHAQRRTVTCNVVGRPDGSCASRRTTLSRARP